MGLSINRSGRADTVPTRRTYAHPPPLSSWASGTVDHETPAIGGPHAQNWNPHASPAGTGVRAGGVLAAGRRPHAHRRGDRRPAGRPGPARLEREDRKSVG